MGQIRVMGRSGDTKLVWNADNRNEVNAANEMFDSLRKKNFTAFHVKANGKEGEVMENFDPTAEKIIMVPPMSGG